MSTRRHVVRRLLGRGVALAGAAVLAVGLVGAWQYWREEGAPPFDPATTDLHALELGSGPRRMLLVHGLAGSARYWSGRVGALAPDHTLLVPDLLGFGESPKPRARYDLDDHDAALSRLMRHRHFERGGVVVVGHSLGAVVALAMAGRHPEWFSAAVLIGAPVFRDRADAVARLGATSYMIRGVLEESWLIRVSHYTRAVYSLPWLAPLAGLPADVYMDSMRHTWNSLTGTLSTILTADYPAMIASVGPMPLLFVHGEEDPIAPIAGARAVAALGRRARFVAIPGGDHQVLLRDPDAVWGPVRAFEAEVVGP
jgi:pimeloyl-ACP methyl ester carboxylesterase